MKTESAGEHAVAESHLDTVARHHARHLNETHDAIGPQIHVFFVITDHNGLARRARRGMKLHHFIQRHGE